MASKRNLKKDINYIFGELIEAVYLREIIKKTNSQSDSELVIDEIIAAFDALIVKINTKSEVKNKAYFKAINQEFQATTIQLVDKINSL